LVAEDMQPSIDLVAAGKIDVAASSPAPIPDSGTPLKAARRIRAGSSDW
jgi:hypothetical protein